MSFEEMLLLATVPESTVRVRRTPARSRRPEHIVRGMRVGGAAADDGARAENAPSLRTIIGLAPRTDEADSDAANAAQWCTDPVSGFGLYAWDRAAQARKGYES